MRDDYIQTSDTHTNTYIHICIHTYLHAYTYGNATRFYNAQKLTVQLIHTHTHTYIHTYIHTYLHAYIYENATRFYNAHKLTVHYVYASETQANTYIHICIYTYMGMSHVYIHTWECANTIHICKKTPFRFLTKNPFIQVSLKKKQFSHTFTREKTPSTHQAQNFDYCCWSF